MKGIQYVVDGDGQKTAVVIDLERYGELWEDFYDSFTAAQRRHEPRESLTQVKRKLQRLRKIKHSG